jgi:hypothetical protein
MIHCSTFETKAVHHHLHLLQMRIKQMQRYTH